MAGAREVLLAGLVDYAGLFPPAGLDMQGAVSRYAACRRGGCAWMLGRFVLPASRLDEFEAAALSPSSARSGQQWSLSAVLTPPLDASWTTVQAFNLRNRGLAAVEAAECRVASVAEVDRLSGLCGDRISVAYEVPLDQGALGAMLDAIALAGGMAKVRMGGLVPDAIPSSGSVAAFVGACAVRRQPFKATAGLHHPVRSLHALTHEPASPVAEVHGFLNVAAAVLFARTLAGRGLDAPTIAATLVEVLEERDPAHFVLSEDGFGWGACVWSAEEVNEARASGLRSVGSCSFEEPVRDLQAMRWIDGMV